MVYAAQCRVSGWPPQNKSGPSKVTPPKARNYTQKIAPDNTQIEFITKKKDFAGKSNSEIQRKITQNGHKIWILLQANQFEYNATKQNKKQKKKKIAQSSTETIFSIILPTKTKEDHNNMKDPQH